MSETPVAHKTPPVAGHLLARSGKAGADPLAAARKAPRGKPVKRFEDSEGVIRKVLTPVSAIRAKCMDCCCGSWLETQRCPAEDCALWPYRMGRRPRAADVEVYESAEDAQLQKDSTHGSANQAI